MVNKPERALCVILALCTAAFYIIRVWGNESSENKSALDESFTVTQRFYGVDAAEMERIAAIPLEDALSGIPGLKRIFSSSENGRTRVVCYFEGAETGRYESVREAAQRVYESLPSAAQRPEINSSGDSRVPVWTAALRNSGENTGTVLEKTIKPALEGLPGAGSVEISGTGLREIVITLKSDRAAAGKIDAADVAAILASNDILLPGGTLRYGDDLQSGREIQITVDGRFNTAKELRRALIPAGGLDGKRSFVYLEDIAEVAEQERDYESRSRLDGKAAALVAVMGSDGADLGKLSVLIGEELAKFPSLEFTILSDRGKAERQARSSALGAALQGACMVALLCMLLCSGRRKSALICSLTVPVSLFFSAALLIIFGFSLDKLVLSGLSAGAGAAVDAAILSAEYFRSCKTREEGRVAAKALRFPLVSGALTTAIALVPLMAQKRSGMNSVAWAIASVNIAAMFLALNLLPPLFLWGSKEPAVNAKRDRNGKHTAAQKRNRVNFAASFTAAVFPSLFHFYRRRLALLVRLVLQRPLLIVCCWLLPGVLGVAALCLNGADVPQENSEDSVYAQIEFESGLHTEETDKLLAAYGSELKKHRGIVSVQTVARTGTGSVLVGFDPRLTHPKTVHDLMRETPVSGAFVYIVESSAGGRTWRVNIAGGEEKRCRELAGEAARLCASVNEITETVLNFKEGSPRINVMADRERLALNGLSFGGIGQTVRRGVHGPVAYKRIGQTGETDVRIKGGENPQSVEEVLGIIVKGESTPLELRSLVSVEHSGEPASIQREDRRRSASISIRTKVMDPRKIRNKVMAVLSNMELPPGYSIEFDPEALKAARGVSAQGILFVFALLFCYMVIAALKESFYYPLVLLAVVPPSLAIPALYMVLRHYPLNAITAAAFVAASGLAINAAALAADALEYAGINAMSYYRVFRRRLPVLAATSLTTIAGALPFLFIKGNAALVVKILSLVSALGVAASALCAVTLIPSLVKLFPGLLKSFGYR